MSSSAITTQIAQLKAGNVQNQADSTSIYSNGVWSFKNSTALTSVTITDAGAVTLGPSSASAITHFINGAVLELKKSTSLAVGDTIAEIRFRGEASTNRYSAIRGVIPAGSPGVDYEGLEFATCEGNVQVLAGKIAAAGGWVLGPSTGSSEIEHLIAGYRTGGSSPALNIQNRSTSTACPAFNVIKGSADTTTGHRLATFTVNGGASGAGQINVNGANACAFGSYSDRRLKENIVPLSGELSKVLALNPVEFDYIEGGHQVGFIAQEIEEIYPDAVSILGETDEMKMVTGWDKTTARLVKAIQELSAKVDAQAAEIEALKAKP